MSGSFGAMQFFIGFARDNSFSGALAHIAFEFIAALSAFPDGSFCFTLVMRSIKLYLRPWCTFLRILQCYDKFRANDTLCKFLWDIIISLYLLYQSIRLAIHGLMILLEINRNLKFLWILIHDWILIDYKFIVRASSRLWNFLFSSVVHAFHDLHEEEAELNVHSLSFSSQWEFYNQAFLSLMISTMRRGSHGTL